MLEDSGLKELIYNDIPKPVAVDAQILEAWQKKVEKEIRILFEGVRNHIVSSFHGKETPYAMWKALIDLFQKNND